ncbi:MAG: FhaA domain-containing protein [Actinomycetota bacterium]
MGLVDDFERRLERAVEGVFSKAFRSEIEPAELGRRLLREMQDGRSVSVGAVYVPNDYVIQLCAEDHARFEGLMPTLKTEFVNLLKANAGQRRWRLPGAVEVRFQEVESLKAGRFEVSALHLATEDWEAPAYDPHVLADLGTGHEHKLDSQELTLGRSSTNDIAVDDANASRVHAQLVRKADQWWIVDQGSTNGTLVNGAAVKERRLSVGDRITIGASEFEFREADLGLT